MSERIQDFIDLHYDTLLITFQKFLGRSGLSANYTVYDLLADVTIEALTHSERWQSNHESPIWLITIGANIIKRKQVAQHKLSTREPLVSDMFVQHDGILSEVELFDKLQASTQNDPVEQIESQNSVTYWLSLLAPDDRKIVQLAILNEMKGDVVAQELGISPGAARMRLHRALKRLKLAIMEVNYHEA